ncbi:hypothetical protein ABBQ38_000355 [Trebouxia sp. C0009 RCD-2024]
MGAATLVRNPAPRPNLTGSPQSPQNPASKHAAVVQDLARRQNVSCPAHPAHQGHWQSGNPDHHDVAVSLESTFASPSFDPPSHRTSASHGNDYTLDLHALLTSCSCSGGSWAEFCIKHDAGRAPTSKHRFKHRAAGLQARRLQLQATFSDINVARAIAKDPLLLTYLPATLKQHMDQLQALLGKNEASAMVTRMPALLHYKTSTLCQKLDDLYDLLPDADIGKMVVRSPFLLGLSRQTLTARMQALHVAMPHANVQSMAQYYPSLLECKIGKVIGNLHALQQLLPATVDSVAVVQYMPMLLLSNMKKVEEKYTRMQILCMHRQRWRKDLTAIQNKPATLARLLGVSHSVLDRLSFLIEESDHPELAASSLLLMSRSKFQERYPTFKLWQKQRDAAQHINLWQTGNALSVLGSLDQDCVSSGNSVELHDITKTQ